MADPGFNPTDPCRGPAALASEAGVAGVEHHPAVELVSTQPGLTNVVLAGRATTVPFTAVLAGPQPTITDNPTVTSTCAVSCRRRWPTGPIWLCKQVLVDAQDLARLLGESVLRPGCLGGSP
ncbi:MAG TPA: hypothetical protein VGM21_02600 [Actinomycetota bacterium]